MLSAAAAMPKLMTYTEATPCPIFSNCAQTHFFYTAKSTFYSVTVPLVLYLLPNILFKLFTPEIKDVIVFVLLDGLHCCSVLIPKVVLNICGDMLLNTVPKLSIIQK